ncbi:hypothetical protein MOK15_02355 [Sphingobium sp. BYY-5]|uniref:amidohydrolase family protein n=1 Tax=Sphingobium sp. BYY-5 TaxID=2926400 RepID=UPI001FA73BCA|nr:hypothetical protein [Sphingobium sp. BYY-5]MCI4588949.1 hypothetical protein [Sphingobium sp. BYY-5]
MLIDAHHHLWRYDAATFGWIAPGSAIARDFSAAELNIVLEATNIDGAIAVQARQSDEETAFLLETAAHCSRRLCQSKYT